MFEFFKKAAQETEKKVDNSLELKVKSLNHSHSIYRNKLLYVPGGRYSDDTLVMFIGFYIKDGEIRVAFADAETPPNDYKYWKWYSIEFMNGGDAIEHWHNRYLKLKNQFSLLGVELVLKEETK